LSLLLPLAPSCPCTLHCGKELAARQGEIRLQLTWWASALAPAGCPRRPRGAPVHAGGRRPGQAGRVGVAATVASPAAGRETAAPLVLWGVRQPFSRAPVAASWAPQWRGFAPARGCTRGRQRESYANSHTASLSSTPPPESICQSAGAQRTRQAMGRHRGTVPCLGQAWL